MLFYGQFHSATFRSARTFSEINALDGDGKKLYREAEIIARFATPQREPLGRKLVYAGNRIAIAPGIVRRILMIDTLPFSVRAQPINGDFQDIGLFYNLEAVLYGIGFGPLARHGYVCLYETHQLAADHSAGAIQRAGEHGNDVDGQNDFWTAGAPNIVLPWQCWYRQRLNLGAGKNGLSTCTFEVEGALLDA